jgi:hypothetical protein
MGLEMSLRRRALELAPLLPENPTEARRVLVLMDDLVGYLNDDQTAPGGSRPSLRAISTDNPRSSPSIIHKTDNPSILRARD